MSPYLSYGIVFVATLRFFGTPKLKPSRVIRKFANPNFVVFEFYNFEILNFKMLKFWNSEILMFVILKL